MVLVRVLLPLIFPNKKLEALRAVRLCDGNASIDCEQTRKCCKQHGKENLRHRKRLHVNLCGCFDCRMRPKPEGRDYRQLSRRRNGYWQSEGSDSAKLTIEFSRHSRGNRQRNRAAKRLRSGISRVAPATVSETVAGQGGVIGGCGLA
jgi:hypothetical protein